MNLPALQRIAMEFERENDIMDQRQEMMDDAIDDITGVDEEEESDLVVEQVLEEIGVDLRQAVSVPQTMNNQINGADITFRWERHLKDYKPTPLQKVKLHKLLEEVVVAIQETVTFKPGLIVSGVE
jgi:charged multivesicular body protein 2A